MQIKYSPSEQRVLALLKNKPQSSAALCERYYHPEAPPFNGRKILIGVLSSLARKAKANRDKFQVLKSERAGPKPIEFWLKRK